MFYKKDRGFTLVEMLIVIIIISILAALALPQFSKTKEYAIGKEAIANLKLISAAEKIYRMESTDQAYFSCYCLYSGTGPLCCDNTTDGCNYFLKLSLNPSNWTYWVIAAGTGASSTFTAIGGRPGSGGYLDCQYSINQDQGDPVPNASCP